MSTMDDTKWKQVLAEEEANVAEADAEVERLEQRRERLQQRVTAPRQFPAAYSLAIPRIAAPADGHRGPCAAMKTVRRPPYPKWNPCYFPCSSLTPLPLSSRRPSVSFGGFGLSVLYCELVSFRWEILI